MKEYQHALFISVNEVGNRLAVTASILIEGVGTVVVGGHVAIFRETDYIACEVILSSDENTEAAFCLKIREAKQFLESSTIWPVLKDEKLAWFVVAGTGMGRVTLWKDCE